MLILGAMGQKLGMAMQNDKISTLCIEPWKVVGNNLIISLINIYVCTYHMLCIHMTHQSFLSELNPSLSDQMFAEKERLDTTDRFLWHGGIQNVTS